MADGVIEIIDWRNQPDRVIDILGPMILLSPEAGIFSRDALIELGRQSYMDIVQPDLQAWFEEYKRAAVSTLQFIVETAKFECRDGRRPVAFRLGMDRNNALPNHPVIAMEPYIQILGPGNYTFCEPVGHQADICLQKTRTPPFRNLFSISRYHKKPGFNLDSPDMLELDVIADVIEEISWRARDVLQGHNDINNGMRIAYRDPRHGIITLDADYSVSRQKIDRSYGAWNSDGGAFNL